MDNSIKSHIQLVNSILLERLGSEHSHQRYQWTLGDDPLMERPMPCYDSQGDFIHDYSCECGTNVSVHSPSCTHLAIKVVRHSMRNPWPWLKDRWTLTKWLPPPSRESWAHYLKSSLPYPLNGFLQPVGDQRKTLALLPGDLPSVTVTQEIARALLENPTGKQLSGQLIDYWKRKEKKQKEKWVEILKECAPLSDPDKTAGSVYRQFSMTGTRKDNE